MRDSKGARILQAFLTRGDRGLNRFEAERLHDHTLPSTVSNLRRDYGFVFHREDEAVAGFGGSKVQVTRYWLTDEDIELARELLGEEAP